MFDESKVCRRRNEISASKIGTRPVENKVLDLAQPSIGRTE